MAIKVRVLKRFTLNGTIDPHDPVGVTLKVTGGDKPFRITFITVNWGRGYDPGVFKQNVLNVLNHVGDKEYVVLLIQELDEDDKAEEKKVFVALMEPGTTLVQGNTREPIAVSPGVKVTQKRKIMTMDQGTKIGAPEGTGPRRYLTSCIIEIHGVKIGVANQHPHRNLPNEKVQAARKRGENVTEKRIGELAEICDFVVHGGDMNSLNYPKSHPRERVLNEKGLDTLRLVKAA